MDTDGPAFQNFCRTFLKHTKSKWQGQPFELEDWQKEWSNELLTRNDDGSRKYQQALLGIARGAGKSTLLSALCIYMLVVESQHERGAEIYALAASRDQGRIIFNEAKRMIEDSPLVDYVDIYRDSIFVRETQALFQVLSSDAPKLHGKAPFFFAADEIHAFESAELWYAMSTAQLKRPGSLGVGISTAGFNRNSILGNLYDRGMQGEEGFFFKWFTADPTNPETWKDANPSSFVTQEMLERESKRNPPSVFARLHCNAWTSSETSWLDAGVWDSCQSDLSIDPGDEVWVGVDLGLKQDSTAIVEVCFKEDKYIVRSHIFAQEQGQGHYLIDDAMTTSAQILEKLRQIAHEQQVREFVFDPSGAYLIMEELQSEGQNVVEFPQSNARMAHASEILYDLITNNRVAHNGDIYLRNHVDQAYVKWVPQGLRLWKNPQKSSMDACIAMAIACERAHEGSNTSGFKLIFFDPNEVSTPIV